MPRRQPRDQPLAKLRILCWGYSWSCLATVRPLRFFSPKPREVKEQI